MSLHGHLAFWLTVCLAIPAITLSNAAVAADESANLVMEEIVVTARKREERLIDVTAALTSLGGEALDQYMTREITDIAELVPGLEIDYSSTGQGGLFQLRGLGSDVDAGVENMVALNFDGVQVNRGRFLRVAMFDLASVNILKGPQALFFGKNSVGGVIALNSTNPSQERNGYLRVGYADAPDKTYAEGAITLPISETLSTRLAFRYDEESGWLDNNGGPLLNPFACLPQPGPCINPMTRGPAQGDVREVDSIFGRITVAWEPTDNFDVLFKYTQGKYEDNGDVANAQRVCPGTHPVVTNAGITAIDTNGDCEADHNTTIGTWVPEQAAQWPEQEEGGLPFSRFEPILSSLTMNWELGDYTLTSVTGYYDHEAPNQGNSDVTTYTILGGANSSEADAISQEFRLASNFTGPVNFMAAVFWEDRYRQYTNNGMILPQSSFLKLDVGRGQGYDSRTGRPNDWLQHSTSDGKFLSVYGQVVWDINERWTLEAGARWLDEEKDVSVSNSYVNDSILAPVRSAVFLPEGTVLATTVEVDDVSPEITLSYRPSTNLSFYGSYKTGFQSGGMSNPGLPPPVPGPEALVFDSMEADGLELGFKFDIPGLVSGDLVVYDYTFDNMQVQSSRFVEVLPGVETVLYTITNAANTSTRGFEFQGLWQTPVDGLTAVTNIAYNKAEYDDYPGAPCFSGALPTDCDTSIGADISGRTLPNAPEWDLRLGLNYDRQLTSDLSMSVSVAANYNDEVYFDQPNNIYVDLPKYDVVDQKREDFWTFDTSARLNWTDKYELALIGRNVTDEFWLEGAGDVLASAGVQAGDYSVAVSPPRIWTLQFTVFMN